MLFAYFSDVQAEKKGCWMDLGTASADFKLSETVSEGFSREVSKFNFISSKPRLFWIVFTLRKFDHVPHRADWVKWPQQQQQLHQQSVKTLTTIAPVYLPFALIFFHVMLACIFRNASGWIVYTSIIITSFTTRVTALRFDENSH